MTIEQREQDILSLVHQLPVLRRIRLALAILREVEPEQIPVEDIAPEALIPPTYQGDEELAQRILSRKQSYLEGKGKHISREELMARIYTELKMEP